MGAIAKSTVRCIRGRVASSCTPGIGENILVRNQRRRATREGMELLVLGYLVYLYVSRGARLGSVQCVGCLCEGVSAPCR